MEEIYDFTVPGNYTYPADITVSGGNVTLTNLSSSTVFTENFNDAVGLTFGAEVEISGGAQAQLVLNNNPGQDFTEDFADDTGFTYNAANTEFTGGLVRQIQKDYKPDYYLGTFFANYDTNINGNYGDGVLTGTAFNGAAVSGGKLDLTGGTGKRVDYNADLNADFQQQGCVRFKYTPNYSGGPGAWLGIFCISQATASIVNAIQLLSSNAGILYVQIYDQASVMQVNLVCGAWSPTSGTEYEFELNYDLTSGATRLFIDGTQFGGTSAGVGTRSSAIGLLRIGDYPTPIGTANFSINDFIVFNYPQHTANYVPSAYGLLDPKQPTFYAGYDEDIDGDWGEGVLTGAPTGGATVSGGELDLAYDDLRYVDYNPASKSTSQQRGCVRMRVRPNYSNFPATAQIFYIEAEADSSQNNELILFHAVAGALRLNVRNAVGASIVTFELAAWNPVAGTQYEIEVNWNLNVGRHSIFIDGTLVASATTIASRGATVGLMRIGSNYNHAVTSNFTMNDFLRFDHSQHTANYTPSWTGILPYEYYGDTITLPEMEYPGAGTLISFDNFITTESNSPRYTLQVGRSGDYLYWDGGAWAVSNNTYVQANPKATFLANLATLPILGEIYGQFRIYTQNNIGTQQSIDELTASLTAQIYSTANPTIDIDQVITATIPGQTIILNSLTETTIEGGSDLVTYQLSNDAGVSWLYWDGAAWSAAVGYAQSNPASQINAQIASFPVNSAGLKVKIFLHSDDGTTTPVIQNLDINYSDRTYSTANPTIVSNSFLSAEGLTNFAATVVEAGSDTITFTVEVDSVEYYWDGAVWATGGSFANSNTAADINTNAATLNLTAGVTLRTIAYIHSNDGTTTPTLSNIIINFDYYDVPAVLPNQCLVTGYLSDVLNSPIAGASVSVRPSRLFTIENTDTTIFRTWITVTTDANGYFEAPIFPSTDAAGDDVTYDFKFVSGTETIYRYNLTVPDQAQIDFGDL